MINIGKGRYWDFGWQLISGCTRCSPGCDNCWSLAMEKRFRFTDYAMSDGEIGRRRDDSIKTHPERLNRPLKRKKPAVYAVWNDLFHEDVPESFQEDVFDIIAECCDRHSFLILTKRPERMAEFLDWDPWIESQWPNVYLGLTVCNQQEADEKIPIFLQVPGKKFLSIEPMLSPISLRWLSAWNGMATKPRPSNTNHLDGLRLFDAVILGAESGANARFMDFQWARGIRNECAEAGVPFFLKSLGKGKGRCLDGKFHNDLPWVKP